MNIDNIKILLFDFLKTFYGFRQKYFSEIYFRLHTILCFFDKYFLNITVQTLNINY